MEHQQQRRALSLRDARERLTTARGKPPSAQSVRLWASKGYRPRGWRGEPAVLRTIRMGADLVTCEEWLAEFEARRWEMGELIRRAELELGKPVPTMRSRKASQRAAARYLDAAGCK